MVFAIPKNVYRNAINLATENGFHINHDMLFSADLQLRDQGCVDVHYSLFKGANPQMDDEIFSRASSLNTMGCDVLIPSPEDIIVIILIDFTFLSIYLNITFPIWVSLNLLNETLIVVYTNL